MLTAADAKRGMPCHRVSGTAPDMMVGTGVFQEPGDRFRLIPVRAWRAGELVLEGRPTGETVFPRQGVLHVPQAGFGGGVGKGALEASARCCDVGRSEERRGGEEGRS